MPQMMPINWMLSLLFFISIFIIFNTFNYYIFCYKINLNNIKIYKKYKLNWKW